MKKKKLMMVFALSAMFAMNVNGQQAGGDNPEFENPPVTQNDIQDDKDVSDVITEFLNSTGKTEGGNTKKDGSQYFIATGSGVIQAPRTHPAYIQARINAYEKSILKAKSQMLEYMGTEISTEAMLVAQEGDFNAEAKRLAKIKDANKKLSLWDKAKMLIHGKLDSALKKEGINPDSPDGKIALKNIINSESFKKITKTLARARILGMQVYKTFEYSPNGSKGKIGVIMIHSDKLQKMAEAMFTGVALPSGTPKKAIKDQIPKDSNILLNMYGVQQKKDENGNLVLVAFAQGAPRTKSTMSRDMAYSKAKISAMALIRQFAGENAVVSKDMLEAETTKEYEGMEASYENDSAMKQKISTQASKMNISGIAQIYKWKAKHPLVGKTVVGVVCTWSPQSANKAQSLKSEMATAPKAGTSSSTTIKAKPAHKYQKIGKEKGSYVGDGAAADDDDF